MTIPIERLPNGLVQTSVATPRATRWFARSKTWRPMVTGCLELAGGVIP